MAPSNAVNQTSQPFELLVSVTRDGSRTLRGQIEDQLRRRIRDGSLRAGTQVPSTRDLARQLGVSRQVAVDAYAQLAAEGYLSVHQGSRPRVAEGILVSGGGGPEAQDASVRPRFDFRPSLPDVSAFPRAEWARSLRAALPATTDAELAHGDLRGVESLRVALAEYLGRVRGVVADPALVVVTCGYTQGLDVVCHALAARGARRIAFEDPSDYEAHWTAQRAGLEAVPITVDADGIRVDELERASADAVVLTPAHQHPTGVVLSSERRAQVVDWLRRNGAVAIEDDYDAEYRYERAAVGALQGIASDRIVYAGSASKTLAPGLRLGWLVVPRWLLDAVTHQKLLSDRGTARIEQHAFADFLSRGELDRHLRRMRRRYRARRDALVATLAQALAEATVRGIDAGLHTTVALPGHYDEQAILAEARRRRIALMGMGELRIKAPGPPTLLLGYGQMPEAAIPAAVRELSRAIAATQPD
jgi:GntR family transcriptional regulator / MocR family aminotransferase